MNPHGAGPGNQNARTHGFYAKGYDEEELADLPALAENPSLDEEIACMRIALRRVMVAASQITSASDHPELFVRLMSLSLEAGRTISRLMKAKHAMAVEDSDGLPDWMESALDTLSEEWGVEL